MRAAVRAPLAAAAPRVHGFTLVEVLVALAVTAVIAAMTWRGIDGMVQAQQSTQAYTDDVLRLQAGLEQWRADLDALVIWPRAATDAADNPRSLEWDGRVLRLTRQVRGTDRIRGVRVIGWARRGDGTWLRWQSDPVLTRAAWRAAWDAAARWAAAGAGTAHAVAVAQVLDWRLHYFRGNAWTNPLSSDGQAASDLQTVPDAVRLFVTLAPGSALSGPLTVDWIRPDFGGRTP